MADNKDLDQPEHLIWQSRFIAFHQIDSSDAHIVQTGPSHNFHTCQECLLLAHLYESTRGPSL